jgi:hypothetical protein
MELSDLQILHTVLINVNEVDVRPKSDLHKHALL